MVTEPHTINRFVKCKPCGLDVAVRIWVGVPRSNKDVVDSPSMVGLANDGIHFGETVWIVNVPGVAGPFSRDFPGIVVMDASSVKGLKSSEISDARRVWSCVEVASDDCREGTSMTGIKICQRNCLSLSSRLGFETP